MAFNFATRLAGSTLNKQESWTAYHVCGIPALQFCLLTTQFEEKQLQQIKQQMELLAMQARQIKDRVELSNEIYAAEISFEPLIGHTYHLYTKDNGSHVLSMIGPNEWGKSKPFNQFKCTCRLMADHTWDILSKYED